MPIRFPHLILPGLVGLAACTAHPPPAARPSAAGPLAASVVTSKRAWTAFDNRMPRPGEVSERQSGGSVNGFDGKLVVRNVSGAPVTIHFPSGNECLAQLSPVDPLVSGTTQSYCTRDGVAGPHDVTLAPGGVLELPLGSLAVAVDAEQDYFLDVVLAAGEPAQRVGGSLRLQIATMAAY